MESINATGFAAALATFLGVWLGHVMVRKVEAQVSRIGPAMAVCVLLGLACEAGALLSRGNALSGALGILGITWLVGVIRNGTEQDAELAADALSVYERNSALMKRVADAQAARESRQ